MFQPNVGDSLTINERDYRFEPHPLTLRIPYGQEGRQAVVYKMTGDGQSWALKVFKPKYRRPYLVGVSKRIVAYANLPGMEACRREVMTPGKSLELLKTFPDLAYAALMPWIDGPTWAEVVLAGTPLEPTTCFNLARSFLEVLVALEESGLSHGDLSGVNIILPLLAGGDGVALVDLEQLYSPGAERPEVLPQSSPGYGFPGAGSPAWSPLTDRYPGSILLAEMLCFCDAAVTRAAWGESFFNPEELGAETERFRLLEGALRDYYGSEMASLFRRDWTVHVIDDCSPFAEWMIHLPETVGTPDRRPAEVAAVAPAPASPTAPEPAASVTPASLSLDQLLRRAEACRQSGDARGAEEIYRYVLSSFELPAEEKQRISVILAGLSGPAVSPVTAAPALKARPAARPPAPPVPVKPLVPRTPAAVAAKEASPRPPLPPTIPTHRRRLKTWVLAAIIACVVVLLAGGAVLAVLFLASPKDVTVPEFEGIQITEARDLAEQKGLDLNEEIFSETDNDHNPGEVVSQNPAPGQKVKKGASVTVQVKPGDISSTAKVTASSTATATSTGNFSPANLVDEDGSTFWMEGVPDYGIGEWVKFTFPNEVTVIRISCAPVVFGVGTDNWRQNGRLKTVTISFDDGTKITHTFEDTMFDQAMTIDPPEKTRSVTITIDEVYPGESWFNSPASGNTAVEYVSIYGY